MLAFLLGKGRSRGSPSVMCPRTKHPGSKLLCEWWAFLCHRCGRLFCASGVPFTLHLHWFFLQTGASLQVALPS